ncbi:hypothetical protein ACFL5Q_04620 [Planctomycetota bacterium]
MVDTGLSLKHVRRNCLECSGGSARYVTWCSADGLHSTRCEFWPFRFGSQPATFRQRFGGRLLTAESMPPAGINLDELPASLEEAATTAIDVEGYCRPTEKAECSRPGPNLNDEERREVAERLRRGREKAREPEIALS